MQALPKPNLFVAAPMSSLESGAKYQSGRQFVLKFLSYLESAGIFNTIYYAGKHIDIAAKFTDQKEAFISDYRALEASDVFVLVYPDPAVSSALVETGIAIALRKLCYIVCRNRKDLPFILGNIGQMEGLQLPKLTTIEWLDENPDVSILADQFLRHYDEMHRMH